MMEMEKENMIKMCSEFSSHSNVSELILNWYNSSLIENYAFNHHAHVSPDFLNYL